MVIKMDLASWQLIRFDCKKKQRKKSNKRDGKVVELSSVFRSSNVLSLQTYIRRREDEEGKKWFSCSQKAHCQDPKSKLYFTGEP